MQSLYHSFHWKQDVELDWRLLIVWFWRIHDIVSVSRSYYR